MFALCLNPCCKSSQTCRAAYAGNHRLFQRQIQRDFLVLQFSWTLKWKISLLIQRLCFCEDCALSHESISDTIIFIEYIIHEKFTHYFLLVIIFCKVSFYILLLIADCHMFLHLLSNMKQMAPLISESIIYHIQIPQRLCLLI